MLRIWTVVSLAAGLSAAQAQDEPLFPNDLGAGWVEVEGYSQYQQRNYKVFSRTCSRCHTLARPINAGPRTRAGWLGVSGRMAGHAQDKPWAAFAAADRDAAVEFLVYDSFRRRNTPEFERRQRELKRQFEELRRRRTTL